MPQSIVAYFLEVVCAYLINRFTGNFFITLWVLF